MATSYYCGNGNPMMRVVLLHGVNDMRWCSLTDRRMRCSKCHNLSLGKKEQMPVVSLAEPNSNFLILSSLN